MRVFEGSLDTASIGFVLLEFHGPLEWLSASRLSHYLGWGSAALVMLTTGNKPGTAGIQRAFCDILRTKMHRFVELLVACFGGTRGRIFVLFDGAIYVGILRREVMVRVA